MEPTSYIPDIPFHTSERHPGQERETEKHGNRYVKKQSKKEIRLSQILRQGRLWGVATLWFVILSR